MAPRRRGARRGAGARRRKRGRAAPLLRGTAGVTGPWRGHGAGVARDTGFVFALGGAGMSCDSCGPGAGHTIQIEEWRGPDARRARAVSSPPVGAHLLKHGSELRPLPNLRTTSHPATG
eukprot:gene10626-biopygen21330